MKPANTAHAAIQRSVAEVDRAGDTKASSAGGRVSLRRKYVPAKTRYTAVQVSRALCRLALPCAAKVAGVPPQERPPCGRTGEGIGMTLRLAVMGTLATAGMRGRFCLRSRRERLDHGRRNRKADLSAAHACRPPGVLQGRGSGSGIAERAGGRRGRRRDARGSGPGRGRILRPQHRSPEPRQIHRVGGAIQPGAGRGRTGLDQIPGNQVAGRFQGQGGRDNRAWFVD